MIKNYSKAALLTVGLCGAVVAVPQRARAQEVGKDVLPTHWAYAAVQDLAAKGLIKGYPTDGKFLGGRVLTRYEMATIIERVLARMDDVTSKLAKGDTASKADLDKLAANVAEIHDLTEEFKKELLVIGSDLAKAKDEIATLNTRMGELATRVDGMDAKIADAKKKADEAGVIADQALENIKEQQAATKAALAKKVDVGVASLRVSGLLQAWYGDAFGKSLGGNFPLNTSGAPPGRNYGGGVGDTFRMRRGEIALIGKITPQIDFRVMFDTAKIAGVSTTTGTVAGTSVVTGVSSNASTNVLQDLWVGYTFNPHFKLEIGQQKTGLSEEGTRSSSQLLTVERSIMNGLPTNAGRVGDIRDAGAVLKYENSMGRVAIGIWNDNGATQNSVDNDRTKFATFSAFYTGTRHLTLGLWGGTNVDTVHPKPSRDRAGGTIKYESGPHTFEAEGAYTLDQASTAGIAGRSIGLGGYALYAHNLSRKWQIVAKYDIWNPSVHGTTAGSTTLGGAGGHNLKEYTIGVNYYLRSHNAKVQLNFIDEDTQSNGLSFFGVRRQLFLSNYQISF